uniref:Uncharacterized protein n=1 Tax=Photinus pyralis TaxID=7054 RepID=A0A1Y1K3E2_PHOPY
MIFSTFSVDEFPFLDECFKGNCGSLHFPQVHLSEQHFSIANFPRTIFVVVFGSQIFQGRLYSVGEFFRKEVFQEELFRKLLGVKFSRKYYVEANIPCMNLRVESYREAF